MKKVISLMVSIALLLSSVSCLAATKNEESVTSLLSELNIMKGDQNGDLRLDDYVSRAEFTKVAVAASKFRNSVAASLTVSPFKDVLYTHWAAPYIKLAVSNKICKGYPDATFNPDGTVVYEEAVTMLLKILGYTDDDFGSSWPYGQIGLADNLGITENVSGAVGQPLTRRDVAQLTYNTLDTKMKGSGQKLITDFDCQTIEDVTLIATSKEDSSVPGDKILTSSGMYKLGSHFDPSYVGRKGDIVIKNGEDFISFAPSGQIVNTYHVTKVIGSDLVLDGKVLNINENLTTYYKSQKSTYKTVVPEADEGDTFITYSDENGAVDYAMLVSHAQDIDVDVNELEKYVVYSKLENAIVGYQNGTFTQIDIDDSTDCYKDKVKMTYSAVKPTLSMGDIIYVKKNDSGEIDYVDYEKGSIDGPYTVTSSDWESNLNITGNVAVMRNGNKVSAGDIQINDIVYYSKDLNMILGYANTVTGIYEKALPNKDMPSSVVVSDVTYNVESVAAFNKLSSSGNFNYGDTVTLLLGKTNDIADVISPDSASGEVYGYLIETGQKEFTKSDESLYSDNYIKLALPDGGVYEYISDRDYKDSKNSIVKVEFMGGKAHVYNVNNNSSVSGVFNWETRKIGNTAVSNDVQILDVTTLSDQNVGKYTTVFPQRIDNIPLNSGNILYAGADDKGEIKTLILNNVTGDAYVYGVVKKAENRSAGFTAVGNYTIDIGGISQNFVTSNTTYSVKSGQVAKFVFAKTGAIDTILPIQKINPSISDVTYTTLKAGSTEYLISDKVVVYKKTYDNNYMVIPLKEIIGGTNYTLSAYMDRPSSNGGRVRVIIATD